jgi:hypothetical protein
MGEKRNAYILLVGEPEERRPLGRPRYKFVNNIKMGVEVAYLICTTNLNLPLIFTEPYVP